MGVRAAVVVVVAVVVTYVVGVPQDDITVDAGGYSGVTVAISDQLDQTKCSEYISSAKAMIQAASSLLFSSTGSQVFFKDVVIAVPEPWPCDGEIFVNLPRTYSWDSAHLRVSPAHHLFGDNPWTQQPGGCGHPGDWIYLPENFVLSNTTTYGSPGSVLVHEWAKFRWGVFEEYGHTGDPIFPAAYLDQNEMQPTYCTDQPLDGILSCTDESNEATCQFTPQLPGNNTATSSLLAAPFADTVVNFCDSNSHNTAAPTKHNLLCDQSSVSDVMNRHSDLQGTQTSLTNTNFSLVRWTAGGPRMVLLLDYSNTMGEMIDRWELLHGNVVQFIKREAAAESSIGVVVFEGKINNTSPVVSLTGDGNREVLAAAIPSAAPLNTGSKNLMTAITRGVELLGDDGGTLVLVTHNMMEYTNPGDLTAAAANNAVWPILYPCDTSLSITIYEELAGISPDTSVLTVAHETNIFNNKDYQSVQNSADLHNNLMTAVGSTATRVTIGSCSEETCNINLEMTNSAEYVPTAFIKVFFTSMEIQQFNVDATTPGGMPLSSTIQETCAYFSITSLENGTYVVSISESWSGTPIIAELWATPATPLGLQVSTWSTKGLSNLQYQPGMAPQLFAKVTNSLSWPVLFADITGQVSEKGSVDNVVNVSLNDAGFGGDVTGNDGIYSGYLVGFEPNMDVSISLTVTDNNGSARLVNPSTKTASTTPGEVSCCGSQLDVSTLQLDPLDSFTLSAAVVSGRLTGESPGTLPPGQVTDLQGSSNGYYVVLTFTAPGGQLDQGTAEGYELKFQTAGKDPYNATFPGQPAGSLVELREKLPSCDDVYTITVEAFTLEARGSTSNSVREVVSCSYVSPDALSPGAIAGITIGCIFGVLLIILIVYLCLNRDHLDELWVWHILTCRCIREKEEDLYRQPSPARRTDVIRSNTSPSKPVRDLSDLYTRPNLTAKKANKEKTPDEDDGGFGEHRRRQENVQRKSEDVESVASSHSTLPINQVGLPVGNDNHGYDDEPFSIYNNVPAPVRYPRANTQV